VQSFDQIDLTAKVQTVRRKTRPWKSIIAFVLAIAAGVFAGQARQAHHTKGNLFHLTDLGKLLIWIGTSVAFAAFGSIATYGLAGKARQLLEPRAGTSHAAIVRYLLLIVGAFTTLVVTLQLFGVPIGQLVLGGALTSVFVGIAAQQALSNVFAGLVLLFARPFRVGDAIRLRAGALGGQLDGVVTDIGITYVRLDTGGSIMAVPNSQVLNAVVGPVPPTEDAPPPPPAQVVADGRAVNPGGPEKQGAHPPGPS
jgi:small-conductance mechanosensitive channel